MDFRVQLARLVIALAFGVTSCAVAELGDSHSDLDCLTCDTNNLGDSDLLPAESEPGDGDQIITENDLVWPQIAYDPAAPTVGQTVQIAITDSEPWANVHLETTGPCGVLTPGWDGVTNNQNGTWTWRYNLGLTSGGEHLFVFTANSGSQEIIRNSLAVSGSGSCLPDVVIDALTVTPAAPAAGASVNFSAVVRNIGQAPTPAGVPIGVGFKIDDVQVNFGSDPGPLAPDATVTISSTSSPWQATLGNHTLLALVDDINRFPEGSESNNEKSMSLTVSTGGPGQIALSRYAMNIDPANPAGSPSAQTLKDANVRWLRIEYKQHKGFGFFDPVITNYRMQGLGVMLIVDYMAPSVNKPRSDASQSEWDVYLTTFLAAVDSVAAHFGDSVDAYQIWNEPDLMHPGDPYDPGVPAATFGRMLRDSFTTIRRYSSKPVVTGGLASGNTNYLLQAKNAVGSLNVDAIAVHPYGQRAPDNWPSPNWGFGNMSTLFNNYLAFGKPLWVSEIGINIADRDFQAQYLENVYNLVKTNFASSVPVVFWFCWSDGMITDMGLVDTNGAPKPAYYRYQTVAAP